MASSEDLSHLTTVEDLDTWITENPTTDPVLKQARKERRRVLQELERKQKLREEQDNGKQNQDQDMGSINVNANLDNSPNKNNSAAKPKFKNGRKKNDISGLNNIPNEGEDVDVQSGGAAFINGQLIDDELSNKSNGCGNGKRKLGNNLPPGRYGNRLIDPVLGDISGADRIIAAATEKYTKNEINTKKYQAMIEMARDMKCVEGGLQVPKRKRRRRNNGSSIVRNISFFFSLFVFFLFFCVIKQNENKIK